MRRYQVKNHQGIHKAVLKHLRMVHGQPKPSVDLFHVLAIVMLVHLVTSKCWSYHGVLCGEA